MATAIFERRVEVGLMKPLGAGNSRGRCDLFAEALLLALVGGIAGFSAGALLAHQSAAPSSIRRFRSSPCSSLSSSPSPSSVTFAGSAAAIRRAVKFDPSSRCE